MFCECHGTYEGFDFVPLFSMSNEFDLNQFVLLNPTRFFAWDVIAVIGYVQHSRLVMVIDIAIIKEYQVWCGCGGYLVIKPLLGDRNSY